MDTQALPQELIRTKRDGQALDPEAIRVLVAGIADGSLSDAQIGAFAMAVYLNGMSAAETVALTEAIRDSGEVLDWSGLDLPGPVLDKHSTGGVGIWSPWCWVPGSPPVAASCRWSRAVGWVTPAAPWTSWRRSPATR